MKSIFTVIMETKSLNSHACEPPPVSLTPVEQLPEATSTTGMDYRPQEFLPSQYLFTFALFLSLTQIEKNPIEKWQGI